VDAVVTASGGTAFGLVVAGAGFFALNSNAIQIQTNTDAATFTNGINFVGAAHQPITGALFKTDNSMTTAYGFNIGGFTATSAEWLSSSFQMAATVASTNSQLKVTGSANGNPKLSAVGFGISPATNAGITLQPLGTAAVTVNGPLTVNGHARFSATSTAPSIVTNDCGSTSQGTVAGTDQSMLVTVGTASVTTCKVTFGTAWGAALPHCSMAPANSTAAAQGTTVAFLNSPISASVTISGTALAGAAYQITCL
jgi:hypothetical protein